jgi:hypothetical protein
LGCSRGACAPAGGQPESQWGDPGALHAPLRPAPGTPHGEGRATATRYRDVERGSTASKI